MLSGYLVLLLLLTGCYSPWLDLKKRYLISEDKLIGAKTILYIRLSNMARRSTISYKNILMRVDSKGVIFGYTELPYTLLYDPIFIPWSSVTSCGRRFWSPGWETKINMADTNFEVSIRDDDHIVIKMCRDMNIELVGEHVSKWKKVK